MTYPADVRGELASLRHEITALRDRMRVVPRCMFAVRYPAGLTTWRYQRVDIASPLGGPLLLAWPPAVGDLIILRDRSEIQPEGGPVFRVVDRMWSHPALGSADWPYGRDAPQQGPLVDVIVQPSKGPYRNEAPICADPSCEAVLVKGSWWMPPGASEPEPHEHRPYANGPELCVSCGHRHYGKGPLNCGGGEQ